MSLEEFQKIINQVVPIAEDVCLHLMGEPLAHPQFEEILSIATKAGAKLQITTNGLLIQKMQAKLLASKGLRQINFSLQAFQDNFPKRPLKGYMDPILGFTKECFEKRDDVFINYRLWNHGVESFNENEEFIQAVENYFSVKVKRAVDPGGIKSKKVIPTQKLYFHFDSRFEWPSMDFPPRSDKGTCQGLRNHFGIHADGTVVPCCLDKEAVIDLGNCLETDLSEILKSTRAVEMKKGFENGHLVEELCKKCTFIKRFDSKIGEDRTQK